MFSWLNLTRKKLFVIIKKVKYMRLTGVAIQEQQLNTDGSKP